MTVEQNRNFSVHDQNWEATSVPERLREAVSAAGGNRVVAVRSGVPLSTLNTYIAGRDMKASAAVRLASACDVSVAWLLGQDGEDSGSPPTSDRDTTDLVRVNYFDVAASAGFGRSNSDTAKPEKVTISRGFLSELGLSPRHTIILQVSGDSMEPTMRTGDRIVVSTVPTSTLDGLAVLVIHGQLLVKRLATTGTGIRIISDNDRYPSETADFSRFRWGEPDGGDAITIIGRVAYRLQALS